MCAATLRFNILTLNTPQEHDSDYLIIKKWITDDFLEKLFAHTRRLQESDMVTRASSTMTELKGNEIEATIK